MEGDCYQFALSLLQGTTINDIDPDNFLEGLWLSCFGSALNIHQRLLKLVNLVQASIPLNAFMKQKDRHINALRNDVFGPDLATLGMCGLNHKILDRVIRSPNSRNGEWATYDDMRAYALSLEHDLVCRTDQSGQARGNSEGGNQH